MQKLANNFEHKEHKGPYYIISFKSSEPPPGKHCPSFTDWETETQKEPEVEPGAHIYPPLSTATNCLLHREHLSCSELQKTCSCPRPQIAPKQSTFWAGIPVPPPASFVLLSVSPSFAKAQSPHL